MEGLEQEHSLGIGELPSLIWIGFNAAVFYQT
jgi:hypothetical protein